VIEGDREKARELAGSLDFLGLMKRELASAYIQEVMSRGVLVSEQLAADSIVTSLQAAVTNRDENAIHECESKLYDRNLKAEIDHDGAITLCYADGTFVDNGEIMMLIAARDVARKAKDFKESDRIRDELLAKGIVLKDGPNGTTWEVKR
jgi:cysteinyl-tRNA synthetase